MKFKAIYILILFLLTGYNISSAQSLPNLRKEYYAAVNDATSANKFYDKLKELPHSDPLILAYFGSAQALKARYFWNPYSKLSYLKDAKKSLEAAVKKKPRSLEIRFLRFSLEHYLPAFLNMSDNLNTDRKTIIDLISEGEFGTVDKALLKNLISFLKESERCTKEEMKVLNKTLANG